MLHLSFRKFSAARNVLGADVFNETFLLKLQPLTVRSSEKSRLVSRNNSFAEKISKYSCIVAVSATSAVFSS